VKSYLYMVSIERENISRGGHKVNNRHLNLTFFFTPLLALFGLLIVALTWAFVDGVLLSSVAYVFGIVAVLLSVDKEW
jgi:hypothetical protein